MDPSGLFSLNQDPLVTCMISTDQAMPTLIGSCNIWYSAQHERWLTQDELLVVQGFPVRTRWSFGYPCCSFAQRRVDDQDEYVRLLTIKPSHASLCKMAGNAMHCNVVGAVLLFAVTQVELNKSLASLMMRERRGRSHYHHQARQDRHEQHVRPLKLPRLHVR
ncbi:unnamed protein product [Symbiodinium sp. CCMP2592]|nr:unnamed protein product [Symbiodinium sp. CCMP2592]